MTRWLWPAPLVDGGGDDPPEEAEASAPLPRGGDLAVLSARAYHATMTGASYEQRRELEALDRQALERLQLNKLNRLLETILPHNAFYAAKLTNCPRPLLSLEQLSQWPFTTKDELIGTGDEWAANRTYPLEKYTRFHRTSGTRGRPLAVLDTPQDWEWWIDTWQFVWDAVELQPSDRVFMAFSFGPFIGFWTAFDAALQRGALVIPGGGLTTLARLDSLRTTRATVVCCTPTYALHMAEVAAQQGIELSSLAVRRLVVAGEPGGSLPAVRSRIEAAWQAQVIDHGGATEVGPWGYADRERHGLHVVESEFIAEFVSIASQRRAAEGELSELVLTTLGRAGSPVIRYRTGDLVRPSWRARGGNRFVLLEGGVLDRADDMLIVRGVNVFPSAIEQILRGFPEVVEYRATVRKEGEMDVLRIEVEGQLSLPERIAAELLLRLGLRVDIISVPPGTLPRPEGKGRRWVDER